MKYEVEIIFTKNKKLQSIILQTNSTDITKLTLPPSTVHVFFSEIGIYDNKTVKAYSFGRAADESEWRNEKEVLPSPCPTLLEPNDWYLYIEAFYLDNKNCVFKGADNFFYIIWGTLVDPIVIQSGKFDEQLFKATQTDKSYIELE